MNELWNLFNSISLFSRLILGTIIILILVVGVTAASIIAKSGGDLLVGGNLTLTGSAIGVIPSGMVVAFNGSDCPSGWLVANGTAGTPDLRGRTIIGTGQGTGLTLRALGATGGEETHVISDAEMPSHTHSVANYNTFGVLTGGAGGYNGGSNFGVTSGSAGSDSAHNNMQPYYALTYCVKE